MPGPTTYPGADTTTRPRPKLAGGATFSKITKLVLHTTETAGLPGYPDFAPQLTYDPWQHRWYQHMPLNRSATTLADPSSTAVRENQDNVLQVEIIAYAQTSITKIDQAAKLDIAELIAWLHFNWGLPPRCTVPFPAYPGSYGLRASQRLTGPEFDAYEGVCGHMHASGNDHGDPGAIDIATIMKLAVGLVEAKTDVEPAPTVPAAPKPAPAVSERPVVAAVIAGGSITTGFGAKAINPKTGKSYWAAGYHPGDDWNGPGEDLGKPAYSAVEGTVVHAGDGGWGAAYGHHVIVQDVTGDRTLHAHLSRVDVRRGQRLVAGQQIGLVGKSGNVTGPHCHVERRHAPYAYGDFDRPVYDLVPPKTRTVVLADLKLGVRSTSGYWAAKALNAVPLAGGRNLPLNGMCSEQLLDEVAKFQIQICDDAGDRQLGPKQTAELARRSKVSFEVR